MRPGSRSSRPRTILLLGACSALSALFAQIATAPQVPSKPAAGLPEVEEPSLPTIALEPFAMPPKHEFKAIWDRPVFQQSRRPFKKKVPLATASKAKADNRPRPKPTPKLRDLSLIGIALIADRRIAVLRENSGDDVLQVFEGQAIDGWQVEEINLSTVTFRFGPNERRIEFPEGPMTTKKKAAAIRTRRR